MLKNRFFMNVFTCVLALFILPPVFLKNTAGVAGVYEDTIYDYNDFKTIMKGKKLKISKNLHIESPSVNNFVSNSSSYFIMGTANPKKELYVNGQEVTDRAKNGCFGVLVNLSYGKNVFKFTQEGEDSQTVNLYYKTPVTAAAEPFREETDYEANQKEAYYERQQKLSAWPASSVVLRGTTLNVFCKAPQNADVKAQVGEEVISLSESQESKGEFSGSIDLTDFIGAKSIKSIGTVKYIINDEDEEKTLESMGSIVYVKPGIDKIAAKITSVHSSVLKDAPGNYDVLGVLKKGSEFVAEILNGNGTTGRAGAAAGGYTKISGVGYTPTQNVQFLPHLPKSGVCSDIAFKKGTKTEKVIISSNRKSAFTHSIDLINNQLRITFENTQSNIDMSDYENLFERSRFVENLIITNNFNNSMATFLFQLKNTDNFWGFNIEYTKDNEIAIYFKKKPKQGEEEEPLKNMTIAVDPGHGVSDSGAPETPDVYKESQICALTAQVVKRRLESLGAKVILTRTDKDDKEHHHIGYDERFKEAERQKADFYISLHANSAELNKNLNSVHGVEVYYWFPQSYDFANELGDRVAKYTKRDLRKVEQAAYVVALQTYSPAVLLEMGFLPCPKEYEKMCSQSGMFNTANAIADSIISYLEQ